MSFAENLKRTSELTYTENGARCVNTTGSALLDLFANIGGMRKRDDNDIINLYMNARHEDKELADNLILYARGIRNGGIGERRIGRILLEKLAEIDPAKIKRNFQTIVDCGRWDDLFIFDKTAVETEMWAFIEKQLREDVENMTNGMPISILSKWMPSINTSSAVTRSLARRACLRLGVTPAIYRKTLSKLRKYLKIVEVKMSSSKWDTINYEQVPSLAMNRYRNAFRKHSPERFNNYIEALTEGKAKINAGTLYPYDLVQKVWGYPVDDPIIEEQWKALPDYLNGSEDQIVGIIDVSGSMSGDPMVTAIGLGIYYAQRNKGAYHNLFLTFSETPEVLSIKDEWSFRRCVERVRQAPWGYNTNLSAAFGLIYQIAKESGEAPKALVVYTDMEIDSYSMGGYNDYSTITKKWNEKFEEIGLKCPKLIWWNIESRHNHMLARSNDNASFCSGAGVGPFKFFTTILEKSAYEAVEEILSKPEFCWK